MTGSPAAHAKLINTVCKQGWREWQERAGAEEEKEEDGD